MQKRVTEDHLTIDYVSLTSFSARIAAAFTMAITARPCN